MNLIYQFKNYISKNHLFNLKDKLLLAVSGGVDSVVLCELCQQAGYTFIIAHCNFQLRGEESNKDEEYVKELAKKYNVEIFVKHFETKLIAQQQKKSIEETARNLRYDWFNKIKVETSCQHLVTAHHADDNIETLLMNFFRGTGIKGLHGILPKQNNIIRPLLFAHKNSLIEFVAANNLTFVTDSTNAQNEFTRNYFRNELIPGLKKVFPTVEENLLKNIERFNEVELLYQQSIALHKRNLVIQTNSEVHIPILKLQQTKPLATILFEIIKDFGFTSHQINDVISLLNSESGKYVAAANYRIIRNRKWLIISPIETTIAQNILIEDNESYIVFTEGYLTIKKLHVASTINNEPSTAILDASDLAFPLLLRKWKQGDYFYPLGMQKKKKLSRFFIDLKLSLTQKEKIWVIESNKKILWVVGLRIDDRFKITPNTKTILQISLSQT